MAWVQWTLEDLKRIADAEELKSKQRHNPDAESDALLEALMAEINPKPSGKGNTNGSSNDGPDRPVYS